MATTKVAVEIKLRRSRVFPEGWGRGGLPEDGSKGRCGGGGFGEQRREQLGVQSV